MKIIKNRKRNVRNKLIASFGESCMDCGARKRLSEHGLCPACSAGRGVYAHSLAVEYVRGAWARVAMSDGTYIDIAKELVGSA